jgi:hypothetical protein
MEINKQQASKDFDLLEKAQDTGNAQTDLSASQD